MTVLEELIESALKVCESSHNLVDDKKMARAAVALGKNGKTYCGCDVHSQNREIQGVSAERACILSAVADGNAEFEVSEHLLSETVFSRFLLGCRNCLGLCISLPSAGWYITGISTIFWRFFCYSCKL